MKNLPRPIADQLEQLAPNVTPGEANFLDHVVVLGYGCVGRPLSMYLKKQGVRNFTVVDKKLYKPESVLSQCVADELGQSKVAVAAKQLRDVDSVTTFHADVSEVPYGIVQPNSILIATFDNRFADAIANVMAIVVKSILITVNIEPLQHAIAVRSYDYRTSVTSCVACRFRPGDDQGQQHPRSCESFAAERPTNGPRPLAEAAGEVGAWVASRVVAGNDELFGKELLIKLDRQRLTVSELPARQPCVADHQAGWPNLTYLQSRPDVVSLRELLPEQSLADIQIEFCHEVSTRCRCSSCGRESDCVNWVTHATQVVGSCSECSGQLLPIPFWSFSTVSASCLESVLDRPLSSWGVPPFGILRVIAQHHDRSFVLGPSHDTTTKGISR